MTYIKNLVVFHLKGFRRPKGVINLAKVVTSSHKPFMPSTCARWVIIQNPSYSPITQEQQDFFTQYSRYYQKLTGHDAYLFLLKWMSGLLNEASGHNDNRVLGDVRKIWNAYQRKKVDIKDIDKLMAALFRDARRVRNEIQQRLVKEPSADFYKMANDACKRMTDIRAQGFEPLYSFMFDDTYDEMRVRQALKARFRSTVNQLNDTATSGQLVPSYAKCGTGDKASITTLGQFKANLETCLKIKQLTIKTDVSSDLSASSSTVTSTSMSISTSDGYTPAAFQKSDSSCLGAPSSELKRIRQGY